VTQTRSQLVLAVLTFCAFSAGIAATPPDGQAQVPLLPVVGTTGGTFRSAVDLVTLNVTVTDARNRHVGGLGRDDFRVLEDGSPQDLTFFAAANVPLDVALLVDTSSSMRDKLPVVQKAAEGFIKTLRPGDRAAVMAFSNQLRVIQAFTGDTAALESAVHSISARGGTALYTSIYIALDHFTRNAEHPTEVRRPAIVVLTDGEDTSSLVQFDDLLERARRSGVAIYPISIIGEWESKQLQENGDRRFMGQSDYSLKTLALETGARAFFPSQMAELNGVYQSVSEELSQQYALGYVPKVERKDGSYRHLVVRVVSRPDARSRTRTGYYSAGPVQAANTR
jgi:Ca-activated chloride channel homolog